MQINVSGDTYGSFMLIAPNASSRNTTHTYHNKKKYQTIKRIFGRITQNKCHTDKNLVLKKQPLEFGYHSATFL
jgi:hypothetical protein